MTEENRFMKTFSDGSSMLVDCNVHRIDFKRGDKVLVVDAAYWFGGTEHQALRKPASKWSTSDPLALWPKYCHTLFSGHNRSGLYGMCAYTFSPASRERAVAKLAADALTATKLAADAVGRVEHARNTLFPFAGSSRPRKCDTAGASRTVTGAVGSVQALAQTAYAARVAAATNSVCRTIKFLTVSSQSSGRFKVTVADIAATPGGRRRRNAKMIQLSGRLADVCTGALAIALLDDVLFVQPNALNSRGEFQGPDNEAGVIFEVIAPNATVYVDALGNIAGDLQCLIDEDEDEEEEKEKKEKDDDEEEKDDDEEENEKKKKRIL